MKLSTLDITVFVVYVIVIIGMGNWVSRGKKGTKKTSKDYFLAGNTLTWWAVGASLIAANISAEQFIGMSGSGFAIGLAIASYEWMAAITLIIVGKFFLPIFIDKGLFTIPEFVEQRFSTTLKTILAVFWIALFVFVNLTTVMFLGAQAMDTIIGTGDGSLMLISIVGLSLFAASYSLWGGLSSVAWTDVVQVVLLVFGGLVTTFIALDAVAPNGGVWNGIEYLYAVVPEKFSLILSQGEIITPNEKDAWWDLPGLHVIIGGIWVANLYYWGFNQYIIQRTLAAKSLKEAQRGIVFASFLKMLIPLIVVIPGIIAYVLNADAGGELIRSELPRAFVNPETQNIVNDNAFPWLINQYVPSGLKGLIIAALVAAIVSSMASMLNSTSTIFTMDIYRPYLNPAASESQMVLVGRSTAAISLVIAAFLAPQLSNLGQVFQYIQEYTGVVSPGILAVFLMGLFWKKATNRAAIWGVVLSIPIAIYFKVGPNEWIDSPLFPELPFMAQMLWTCLLSMLVIVVVSYLDNQGKNDPNGITLRKELFQTDQIFNLVSIFIFVFLAILYAVFW